MKTAGGRSLPVVAMVLVVCAALPCGSSSAAAQTQPPAQIAISPALPAEGDLIFAGLDVTGPPAFPSGSLVEGSNILLYFSQPPVSPQPPPTTTHLWWPLGSLPAGNYSITLNNGTAPSVGFAVKPRAKLLALIGGRFQMSVVDQEAGASPAAVQMSDAGGYFTFFDPTNIELTAKIVDGRAVNGHYWVFVASMTNTALTITVTDTQTGHCGGSCPTRTYSNPPNTNQNFIDVEAF
jgi:hypothetical protein